MKNILFKSSKTFFYFGICSCIFLILHAIFLGLDIESILFKKMRRVIIILFIFFELLSQVYLTRNLFKFKKEIKSHHLNAYPETYTLYVALAKLHKLKKNIIYEEIITYRIF